MRSLLWLTLVLALSNNAKAADSNAKLADPLERIRLVSDLPIFPGPAALLGTTLYVTEKSTDPDCAGKGIYRIEASAGKWEQVTTTPCIQSLQIWDGKLGVEYCTAADREKMATHFGVLDDKKVVPSEKLAFLWPQISLSLYGLGVQTDPEIGARLRQASFRSLSVNKGAENARVFYLAEKPRSLTNFPDFVVGTLELKDEAKPVTQFLGLNKKERIVNLVPGAYPSAYALSRPTEEAEYSFLRLDLSSGKVTERQEQLPAPSGVRYYRRLEHLTSTPGGAMVFYEPGDQKTVSERLWIYDPATKSTAALSIANRDLLAVSAEVGGILVSRRSGIDWYGVKGKLTSAEAWTKVGAKAQAPEACGKMKIVRSGKSDAEIFTLLAGPLGENEYVSLGRLEGVEFIECQNNSVASVSWAFRPNLLANHLKVGLVAQSTDTPASTNVKDAVVLKTLTTLPGEGVRIGGNPLSGNLLFHFAGDQLKMVRAPFAEVRFGAITKTPKNFVVGLIDAPTREPYFYDLTLNAEGTGVVRYFREPAVGKKE